MFRNYLAAALRNLVRNKLYATINIGGLTLGFAAALFIALFVRDELSYDRWLPGSAGVYMLSSRLALPNQKPLRTNLIPEEITPAMKLEFAGVDKVVRLQPDTFGLRHNQIEFADQRVYFADPEFFSVIQLPALAGDLKTALDEPDSVVITRAAARKYFGKDAPIGEVLELDRVTPVTVTAVLKDLPSNTQFNAEVLISSRSPLSSATRREKVPPQSLGWGMGAYARSLGLGAGSYTYFTLKPGAEIEHVEAGLTGLIAKYKASVIPVVGPSPLFVLPMTAFHLQSGIQGGAFATLNPPGDLNTIKAIAVVGMLVLFIAAINFVNLSTARASRRAVEVGMRKTVGAQSPDLIVQFIGESVMYVAFGMAVAMAVVVLALPAFNAQLKRTINFDYWTDPLLFGGIVVTTLVVGISAGAYPAFVLSRFRPTATLKSTTQGAPSLLRSALVVLQFAILIGFLAMTFVVSRQTTYALGHGVKLDTNRVYVMTHGCADAVQNGVKALPEVVGMACSGDQVLGGRSNVNFLTLKDGTELTVGIGPTGFGFFELYDIKPLRGRVFQRDHADQPSDEPSSTPYSPYQSPQSTAWPLIVNETLARKINASDVTAVVGQTVTFRNLPSEIIAVVPDFAIDAAHHVIPPTIYYMMPPRNISEDGLLSLKLSPGADEKTTFEAIDKLWKDVGEPRPVSRYAMKGFLENLNADMIAQTQTFTAFSALAVFIAAIGLFGLSAFTAERRTKEIGVRKAMGATRRDILWLLLSQFTRPVLWANLIAWPVAYFFMLRWLEGFAYHIDLAPWMFLAPSAIAIVIALATVLGHALLVARAQPANALRYE